MVYHKVFFQTQLIELPSLDLYPNANSAYYIDDVCYNYDTTQIVLPNLDLALSNINSISGLASQNRDVLVDVINLGLTTITSFDIDFDYNGNIITENVSGVNIPMLSSYSVIYKSYCISWRFKYWQLLTISNVNGLGPDNVPSNDRSSTIISS